MEVAVLKKLQSCSPHICTLLGCGKTDRINYIIMTLLGPNLSELRKQQPKQKFSLSTTLRVGVQVIAALRAMHNCGFLHRDIKPSNFAIGGSSVTKRTCYMLDFGLSRQFKTSSGDLRLPRPVAGFRGTVRYASINAHQSHELGRHDDLWSVFYLLIELANGELPWKKIRDKDKAGKFKLSYDHKKLLRHLPTEFYDFLDHLKSLDYHQEPNYVMLSRLLKNAIGYLGIKWSDPFDWEHDHSVQSLTTMSAGSAPALQTNEKAVKGKDEADADSRTHVPTDEEGLSQNAEKKCGENKGKEHTLNAENGRIPPVETTKCDSAAQPKHAKGKIVAKQLQHRRSMPPSPLLQATHLINHNTGSVHADSLDRFFDMRIGDSRSGSLSGKSCSRGEHRQSDKIPEKEENVAQKSPDRSRSKSTSPTASSNSRSRHQVAAKTKVVEKNTGQSQPPVALATDKGSDVGAGDAPKPTDQSHNLGQCVAIHPDTTPAPQLAYTTEQPTAEEKARVEGHHVVSGKSNVPATRAKEKGLKLPAVKATDHLQSLHEGMRTVENSSKETKCDGSSKMNVRRGEKREDGSKDADFVEEKSDQESWSESSGLQHRLFACGIQGEEEQVKRAEILPLEPINTVPRNHGTYSPGPPPLEFGINRPQEVWGQDSSQPMSLTRELTYQTIQGEKRNEIPHILPRPPEYSPPKHYALMAARRRRFRRPGNT